MTVSRETAARLTVYRDLLSQWNHQINLVSSSTLLDMEGRHFADCLQLVDLVEKNSGLWVDLGSGAGLPGLAVAIAKDVSAMKFILVDSDERKAAFLRTVIRETDLTHVTVRSQRIETLPPLNADYVSARALAPLNQLMAYLSLHLAPSGTAFLMKGVRWKEEVSKAREKWTFDYIAHPSQTQQGAAILEVSGVRRGRT